MPKCHVVAVTSHECVVLWSSTLQVAFRPIDVSVNELLLLDPGPVVMAYCVMIFWLWLVTHQAICSNDHLQLTNITLFLNMESMTS